VSEGEAKGKAEELKGKAKGTAAEAEGKAQEVGSAGSAAAAGTLLHCVWHRRGRGAGPAGRKQEPAASTLHPHCSSTDGDDTTQVARVAARRELGPVLHWEQPLGTAATAREQRCNSWCERGQRGVCCV
jgi:hypothetical protein